MQLQQASCKHLLAQLLLDGKGHIRNLYELLCVTALCILAIIQRDAPVQLEIQFSCKSNRELGCLSDVIWLSYA